MKDNRGQQVYSSHFLLYLQTNKEINNNVNMEKEKKNLLKSFIDFFDYEEILDEMRKKDIAEYIENNTYILDIVSDETLLEGVSNPLGQYDSDDLIEELNDRGYEVKENNYLEDNNKILDNLGEICRMLYGKGYIGKKEAKSVLSDFLDTWMTNSF